MKQKNILISHLNFEMAFVNLDIKDIDPESIFRSSVLGCEGDDPDPSFDPGGNG